MTSLGIDSEMLSDEMLNEMQIPFICISQDESSLRFPLHLLISESHTLRTHVKALERACVLLRNGLVAIKEAL